MRRFVLVWILLSLLAVPVAHGQSDRFPTCTESELLILLSRLLDVDILDAPPIRTRDDLISHASEHLEGRDNDFALLPLCADAIPLWRDDIIIKGDLIAEFAVKSAGRSRRRQPLHYPGSG